MKKLKKYRVTCSLSAYGFYDCEATSKKEAKDLAWAADRKGDIHFSDYEMEIVETTRRLK